MRIETQRLLLRSLQPEDIGQLVRLWTDPEVTRYLGGAKMPDEVRGALERELHEEPPGRFELWPVIEKSTDELVGHCGLLEKNVQGTPEIELVYVFSRQVWGRGYAEEIGLALLELAFGGFGLRRVISLIEPANARSRRVALKLGMRSKGTVERPDGVRELHVLSANGAQQVRPADTTPW
jgi:ribosomal-protein-alanine N-acetyltransferase